MHTHTHTHTHICTHKHMHTNTIHICTIIDAKHMPMHEWSQTQGQEMTHRYHNTFGDILYSPIVKYISLYFYRKEMSVQLRGVMHAN